MHLSSNLTAFLLLNFAYFGRVIRSLSIPLFSLLLVLLLFSSNKSHSQEANWLDFEELEVAMEQEERLVLIDFYTSWCGWCKKMDRSTFKDPRVVKALSDYFHVVKFDAEHNGPITFQQTTFDYVPYGRRGFHELALGFMQEKMTFPTLVILNSDYKIMQAFKGFQAADDLLPILEFIGSGVYKEQKWEVFMSTWKGK